VQAFNPATKTQSTQTVQNVFINHDTDLIDVTLALKPIAKSSKDVVAGKKQQDVAVASHGSHAPPMSSKETIHTTQKHPWLTTQGWITAGNLHLGDQVLRLDGETAMVVALKVVPGEQNMYDLTVSNMHTFAVGVGQWVVHNCTFGSNKDPIDMGHILDGHSDATYQSLVQRSANGDRSAAAILTKDTHFVGQSNEEIAKIIREAWINRVKAGAQQVDPMGVVRQMWRGTGRGWQVEGWYNITERIVETAYPVFR
jgi:hypothetical protein